MFLFSNQRESEEKEYLPSKYFRSFPLSLSILNIKCLKNIIRKLYVHIYLFIYSNSNTFNVQKYLYQTLNKNQFSNISL